MSFPDAPDKPGDDVDDGSPFLSRPPLRTEDALRLLESAEMEILGRMPYSSNATFLADLVVDGDRRAQGIYKPELGEQPLWDFSGSLYQREVGAFLLSEQLGWGHVPPTIEVDGPAGIGSLQLFIPAEFEQHYFTLLEQARWHPAFMEICAFDFVANNTDRKAGHILLGQDDQLWAIDNGLSFHHEFKLRTVIWDFAGYELSPGVIEGLTRLLDIGLADDLAALLTPLERDATLTRARSLLHAGKLPTDPTGRRYPWPMI